MNMMNLPIDFRKYSSLGLVALAIGIACLAVFTSVKYLEKKEAEIKEKFNASANYQEILVVMNDLNAGDVLSNDNLTLLDIPARFVPDGALRKEDFKTIDGHALTQAVSYGKPVLRSHVYGLSSVDSFSALVPEGYRAITLEISNLYSNENMLVVGDYVDILVSKKAGLNDDVTISPVIDRIQILATGVTSISNPYQSNGGRGYDSVTIAVEEKSIPEVLAAKEMGELVYLLRNSGDEGKSRYGLLDDKDQGNHIEVISGGNAKSGLLNSVKIKSSNQNRVTPEMRIANRAYKKFPTLDQPDQKTEVTSIGAP
jgi:pilus assembly protein CpaB